MNIILFTAISILGIAFFLFFLLKMAAKKLGVLTNTPIYVDTNRTPGEILYAKSLPLSGKPDYLITENDLIIPVEVKTGKTPVAPHLNHTMQLMAYCYLVEEVYGIRPPGGIVKYPEKEFRLEYTDKAKNSIRELVSEIITAKEHSKPFLCAHAAHNR